MKESVKDVLIRAGKTFWQATVAALVIAIPEVVELLPKGWEVTKPMLISVCVGAIAAGLSAAYNGVILPVVNKLKAKQNGGDSSIESK